MPHDTQPQALGVDEAVELGKKLLDDGCSSQEVCEQLVDLALRRGTTDNVTCMLVELEAYRPAADAGAVAVASNDAQA